MPPENKNHRKKFWKRHLSVDSVFGALNHRHLKSRTPDSHSTQSSFREDRSDTISDVMSPNNIEKRDSSFNPGGKITDLVMLNDALVEEVADLRSDKSKWLSKVNELEHKVYTNLTKIDEWLDAGKGLRQYKELEQTSTNLESCGKRNHKSPCKANSLKKQKNDLEISISESKRNLWEACQRAEWMEFAAIDANDKLNHLKEELEKLRSESQMTLEKKMMLEAERRKQETTLIDLETRKQEQDVELKSLKEQKVALQLDLQRMSEAFNKMKQENGTLREMLEDLGSQNEGLEVKVKELSAEQRRLYLELEQERVCQEALAEDISDLQIQKEELEQELSAEQGRLYLELEEEKACQETLGKEIRSLQIEKEELSAKQGRLYLELGQERACRERLMSGLQTQNEKLSAEKTRIYLELEQERACQEILREEITALQIQKEELEQELASARCLMQHDAVQLSSLKDEGMERSSSLEEEGCTLDVIANPEKTSNMGEEEEDKQKMQGLEIQLGKAKKVAKQSVSTCVHSLLTEIDLLRRVWERKERIAGAASVSVSALITLAFFALYKVYKRR